MRNLKSMMCGVTLMFISNIIQASESSSEINYSGHPIIGSWSFTYNNCVETYQYHENGIRKVTSNQEIVEASFTISNNPLASGFYKINDKVLSDNGKPDCEGSTKDMSGDIVNLYAMFNSAQDKVIFCFEQNKNRCFGPFTKVSK